MPLHNSTFSYLKPTEIQLSLMNDLRALTHDYAMELDKLLPDGADKTYILRRVRETAMWINVCITREADGTPRS
jgi:queuine/archaeosine tRNA-ribosyltransferase